MANCETNGHLRGVGDKCMMCKTPMSPLRMSGSQMIDNERTRQITSEGWTAQHDDEHDDAQLVEAARAYTWAALCVVKFRAFSLDIKLLPNDWPKEWDKGWWKPSDDPIRNLTKAGALIAAEIDRLQRMG